MKKNEKTVNLAARLMAEKRGKGVPAAERSRELTRVAKTPRNAKRCFCGETSTINAANGYFDCCRRAGVITLHVGANRQAQLAEQEHATEMGRSSLAEVERLREEGRAAVRAGETCFGAGGYKLADMMRAHFGLEGYGEINPEHPDLPGRYDRRGS